MPSFCASFGCSNSSCKKECFERKISFHSFPLTDSNLLKQWLLKMRRDSFQPTRYSKICSEHFEAEDFRLENFTGRRFLNTGAVPSKFSFGRKEVTRQRTDNVTGFPLNSTRNKEWIRAVRRKDWQPCKSSVLCSRHFTHDQIDRSSVYCQRLRENAVPTIFWPYTDSAEKKDPHPVESNDPDEIRLSDNRVDEDQEHGFVVESVEGGVEFSDKMSDVQSNSGSCNGQLQTGSSASLSNMKVTAMQINIRQKFAQLITSNQTSLKLADQTSLKLPDQTSLKLPDQTSLNLPDQTSLNLPDQTSLKLPDQTSLKLPDQTSLKLPDQTSLKLAEQSLSSSDTSVPFNKNYHALLLSTVRSLRDKLDESHKQKIADRRKIKMLQQKVRRCQRKIMTLKTSMKGCCCQDLIDDDDDEDIEDDESNELLDLPMEENELFTILKFS